jgi:microsomal dipeptidase-like Zn-dependent dipeptidase
MGRVGSFTALAFLLLTAAAAPAQTGVQTAADAALVQKARAIHDRVITLDTHDDINPENFTRQKNYTQRLDTQVNLPKMVEGGLDVSFFIVYVGQGPLTPEGYDRAYQQAIAKFDAIKHLTSEIAPDQIGLALTAADVPRIARSGKKVALIGIENAYSLGTDIKRVKEFFDRGGRYMSLAHNGHSQFADSNTGERDGKWLHNGLSELGKQAIAEMNKWGIMVDLSHPSKAANLQAMALSKAPVIASHSAARALADHSRNMDDEQLLALKKNGGVIQTVAFASYVKIAKPDSPERATVADFVNHIDYLVKKIGIDHVGISSDFDGGGGVTGWNGAEETFNVTLELVRRGYSEEQIAKIWSGNLLRVMAEVEKVATHIQAGQK